jgi:hypothetical protein
MLTTQSLVLCLLALCRSAHGDADEKYGSTQNLEADPISAAASAQEQEKKQQQQQEQQQERRDPPPDKSLYPPPTDWIYNTSAGTVPGKLNVHLVPHSHDDVGWLLTVDQYFDETVSYMLDTVVQSLADDPHRTFIEVETGFFARWWDVQAPAKRAQVQAQVAAGSIEVRAHCLRPALLLSHSLTPFVAALCLRIVYQRRLVHARRGLSSVREHGRSDDAGPPVPAPPLQRHADGDVADRPVRALQHAGVAAGPRGRLRQPLLRAHGQRGLQRTQGEPGPRVGLAGLALAA